MALWLIPTLASLLLYGIGQGLVKQYIAEVPPARFCLYFVAAKALLNLSGFALYHRMPLFGPGGAGFARMCLGAYVLDGCGWLLYFQSIVQGPIAIVGTLSAAYPALTVLFAHLFLGEALTGVQYAGVAMVIGGCVGLSYDPGAPAAGPPASRRWIPLSFAALLLWGCSTTLVKAAYRLPGADEVNAMVFNTIGSVLTLGVYGLAYGGGGSHTRREWVLSFVPMGMLAGGDIGFIVATRYGPVSLTTPLSGAYPIVTVIFARLVLKETISFRQAFCIASILVGMAMASGSM